MREDVLQARHLRLRFIADDDRLIASAPHFVAPPGQATDLTGEIGIEVSHELSKALSVGDGHEKVVVIRHEDKRMNLNGIASSRSRQDTDSQVSQVFARTKKKSPLNRAASDLNKCPTLGDEAKAASHLTLLDGKPGRNLPESPGT